MSEREEGKRAGSADEGEARTLLEYVGGSLGYTATLLCRAQAAFLQSQDVTNLQEVRRQLLIDWYTCLQK